MTVSGIHPIQSLKTTWNNASKPKKAAMVAGGVLATGAVAATVAAVVKGKAPADAEGFAKITGKLKDGFTQVWNGVKGLPELVKAKFAKAPEVVEEVAEKAE